MSWSQQIYRRVLKSLSTKRASGRGPITRESPIDLEFGEMAVGLAMVIRSTGYPAMMVETVIEDLCIDVQGRILPTRGHALLVQPIVQGTTLTIEWS